MNEDIFKQCQVINNLYIEGKESDSRDELIKLLDYHSKNNVNYTPLINHLIREIGLYQYIVPSTSNWDDRFIREAFSVDVGEREKKVLHKEQSFLLKELLNGKSIVVSAPTSFGKSFIIDAFISLKNPKNIVIIVPTIALTDEIRRRLYKKFASQYKIITTQNVSFGGKNILIFPQERAYYYIDKIDSIDILIVDEFYKADEEFDKERASILKEVILSLGKKAKQKYFLAPNIKNIKDIEDNPITKGMNFISLDFNTVYTKIHQTYNESNKEQPGDNFKNEKLIKILQAKETKSLIYAGSLENIKKITKVLNKDLHEINDELLDNFSDWLKTNYFESYILADLVKKGVGIHNGRLHRSLSQIQIKLFEEEKKINNIISTSSIIEGVNTSAENVIIWTNKIGRKKLDDFTYKNIIGRGGRMFKYFIGQVYLLEAPPKENTTQLSLDFEDDLVCSLDNEHFKEELTKDQIKKNIEFNDKMKELLGEGIYKQILNNNSFHVSGKITRKIAIDMKENPNKWKKFSCLNSQEPNDWEYFLKSIFPLIDNMHVKYTDMVEFIKCISNNWYYTIPQMLNILKNNKVNIDIEKFFDFEKDVTFKLANILNYVNILYNTFFIQKVDINSQKVDISPFIAKITHAFLPRLVFELEEYGLPRMISKKIHESDIINLEDNNLTIHKVILNFNKLGCETVKKRIKKLHPFEDYFLNYFFDGIQNI